jgi:hypothetical protein
MTKIKNVFAVLIMLGAALMGGCGEDNDPDPNAPPSVVYKS